MPHSIASSLPSSSVDSADYAGVPGEREERFRTLAESSPTGVYQTDPRGVVTYANQRLLEWFGQDFATFASGAWMQRIHPDDAAHLEVAARSAREEHAPFDSEYRIVVNGRVRWLRVRSEVIFDSAGNELGHIGSVLDTSAERFAAEERTRLQAQLQQSRRLELLGLLAGGVAHDFNNLLVGILANASMAREELLAGHPSRDALDDIANAAQRAADLTRQLLAYAGRARVERRQVLLAPLAAELPKMLGARVPPHVQLLVQCDPERPDDGAIAVDGDETQLRQVVLNLVTNAVDAVGATTGTVRLSITERTLGTEELQGCLLGRNRPPGRYAVIAVNDSGAGMSTEVQERMFDPFFTTKTSGRGLGLAATLGILNSHGGAIQVESAVGQGTTIRVLLPVSRERATPPGVPAVLEAIPDGSGMILVVDDDAGARNAARRILQRAGYQVEEAENGADALARFDALSSPPRCLVLDLSMPVMGGDECLRTLRARGSTVPVLMSSGYDADDVASHLVSRGSVHFLQKPYTAHALLSAIAELVSAPTAA
jgi:PAS domain S-box-containing protein